jgi:hypothetical protein
MTAKQITKKLQNAGISLDGLSISRDEVEVCIKNQNGEVSTAKTLATMRKINRTLGFGSFRCAYGGWVCHEGKNHIDTGNCL